MSRYFAIMQKYFLTCSESHTISCGIRFFVIICTLDNLRSWKLAACRPCHRAQAAVYAAMPAPPCQSGSGQAGQSHTKLLKSIWGRRSDFRASFIPFGSNSSGAIQARERRPAFLCVRLPGIEQIYTKTFLASFQSWYISDTLEIFEL